MRIDKIVLKPENCCFTKPCFFWGKKIVVWYHRITNFFLLFKNIFNKLSSYKIWKSHKRSEFSQFFFKEWMFKPRLYWIFFTYWSLLFCIRSQLAFFLFLSTIYYEWYAPISPPVWFWNCLKCKTILDSVLLKFLNKRLIS